MERVSQTASRQAYPYNHPYLVIPSPFFVDGAEAIPVLLSLWKGWLEGGNLINLPEWIGQTLTAEEIRQYGKEEDI